MIGWILFAITAVVAAIALAALKRKSDAELRQLEEAQRSSIAELESESNRRVQRLRREADAQQARSRDRLAVELFSAVDSLHAAIDGADDPDVQRGVQLVLDDVYRAFEHHDIEPIGPAVGDPFDPNLHEAIEVAEDSDVGAGKVARCHRQGFVSGDRVLRPAMVSVGAKKPVESDESDEQEKAPIAVPSSSS